MAKELLFSVTEKDCKFTASRGSGRGGQKRNKTSTKVRCVHKESGAVGVSDDTRDQHKNKRIAFKRMSETQVFCEWHTRKICELTSTCDPKDIQVEVGHG